MNRNIRNILAATPLIIFLLVLTGCDSESIRAAVYRQINGPPAATDSGAPQMRFSESTPYNDLTYVAVNTAVDIYEAADMTSARLAQLLFDEPVQIIERTDKWVKIRVDGIFDGWARLRNLDGDWTCVDARRYPGRIIVTNKEKQIYSHPRNGIVIRDVGMGTEIFIINKTDNVYEVALPGNLTGWVSENGVFQLGVDEEIKRTSAEIFAQSCAKFRGASYLRGGAGFQGIDGAGMLHIVAKINGVRLPRDFNGQFALGEASADGIDGIQTGDALFFSSNGDSLEIADVGVYTGDEKFIHASQHTGKVQYEDIGDPYFQQRILGVKRYF